MMRNSAFNWCFTVLGIIAIAALYGDAMFQHGRETEAAKCRPTVTVPKKSLYDLTTHQLRRMIRYEQAKGL